MSESRDHAEVKIQPPLLTMIFIVLAYLAWWALPIPLAVPRILRLAGFGLVVTGFLLGAAALSAFRKARTTWNPHGEVSTVVTDGIYRFTRNPIYLGFLLMLIGFPLDSGNIWGILLAPVFIMAMNSLVIEREEAYLEKKFRDAYTGYKSRVRRWL